MNGERNSNPLQYSCLENSMDRGAWQATVHRAAKSQTWLKDWTHTYTSRPLPTEAERWAPSSGVGGNSPLAFPPGILQGDVYPRNAALSCKKLHQCLLMSCLPGYVWMWWFEGMDRSLVWRGCTSGLPPKWRPTRRRLHGAWLESGQQGIPCQW